MGKEKLTLRTTFSLLLMVGYQAVCCGINRSVDDIAKDYAALEFPGCLNNAHIVPILESHGFAKLCEGKTNDGKTLKSGPFVGWYENKTKGIEGTYSLDKREGHWVKWWENGHKKSEGIYRADLKNGVWRYWDDKGVLRSQVTYASGKPINQPQGGKSALKEIIPGKNIGPIDRDSTEKDLVTWFGKEHVIRQANDGRDAESSNQFRNLIESKADAVHFLIFWDWDDGYDPTTITLEENSTRWRTPSGITVGTTLNEMERINGKEIDFEGTEDGQIYVSSWNKGKLEKEMANLGISLSHSNQAFPDEVPCSKPPCKSNDPKIRGMDWHVSGFVFVFEP